MLCPRPDVFDLAQNKWPFLTVYDAGGNDTINLSGFTASQFLDLHGEAAIRRSPHRRA